MPFRNDLLSWQIPLTVFQKFDHGEIVSAGVPLNWNLKPGDVIEYELGEDIYGLAAVIRIGELSDILDYNSEGLKIVSGVLCFFKKIN